MLSRIGCSIGGVNFIFETPSHASIGQRLTPFISEVASRDWSCRLIPVAQLPVPSAESINCDWYSESFVTEPDQCLRRYFEYLDGGYAFAVASCDAKAGTVELYCNETSYRNYFNTLDNIANHICVEWLLQRHGRYFLHASCVDTSLGGILFTGPSGVGKSTQADLWCNLEGARLINGDRTLLHRTPDGWMGWGSPIAGSSDCYVNDRVSLRAIVMLRQAEENELRPAGFKEAFTALFEQMTVNRWDRAFVERALAAVEQLVEEVSVYVLECRPDAGAVALLKNTLLQEGLKNG